MQINLDDFLKKEYYMLSECRLLDLPRIEDPTGCLSFIQEGEIIPFKIKRVYYLYDVRGGSKRGSHAHKTLHQLLVATSGSFDVNLTDGLKIVKYSLNRPYQGLYVPPMLWRTIDNFSSGSVCMVLASEQYDELDYFRDYGQYLKSRGLD